MTLAQPRPADYENPLLVDVVFEKSRCVTPGMLAAFPSNASARRAAALAVEARGDAGSPGRVLDFGGACGLHYAMAREAGLNVRWAVVETPAMVRKAASAARGGELRYFDTIEAARDWLGSLDCVYSSGALQYVPDPRAITARLLALGAPIVTWARLNLTEGPTQTFDQVSRLADNGPGPLPTQFEDCEIRYPCTRISERAFLDWHADYDIIERSGPLDDATFYFRRRPRKATGFRLWPFGRTR